MKDRTRREQSRGVFIKRDVIVKNRGKRWDNTMIFRAKGKEGKV